MREMIILRIDGKKWPRIVVFLCFIFFLIPVGGYAEVYHYIDVDGVD